MAAPDNAWTPIAAPTGNVGIAQETVAGDILLEEDTTDSSFLILELNNGWAADAAPVTTWTADAAPTETAWSADAAPATAWTADPAPVTTWTVDP